MIISLFSAACSSSQNNQTKFPSQNNEDFAATINMPDIQLIDVRTPLEFSSGHIPGAINIDVNNRDFDKQTGLLNKNHPVAVYCRSGVRSKTAANKLVEKGYTVYELDKGILNWKGKIVK